MRLVAIVRTVQLITGFIVLFGLFAAKTPATAATGASFDCAKAGAPIEKMICGDSTLAQLDGSLGEIYQKRKSQLDADGAQRFILDQRAWLSGRFAKCHIPKSESEAASTAESSHPPLQCLKDLYVERLNTISGAMAQHSKPGQPWQPVIVLYSANDALCKPLADLYGRLTLKSEVIIDLEDHYAGAFRAIGLKQPKPLDDKSHPLNTFNGSHATYINAYYRVRFAENEQPRLVSVLDTTIGDHGDFSTDLWIFKPGLDDDADFPFLDSFGGHDTLYASRLDFAFELAENAPAPSDASYKVFKIPYYFERILTPEQRADIHSKPNHTFSYPGLTNVGPDNIQRIFEFKGTAVVLANDGVYYLVYQFKDGRIDDVCYLKTNVPDIPPQ